MFPAGQEGSVGGADEWILVTCSDSESYQQWEREVLPAAPASDSSGYFRATTVPNLLCFLVVAIWTAALLEQASRSMCKVMGRKLERQVGLFPLEKSSEGHDTNTPTGAGACLRTTAHNAG